MGFTERAVNVLLGVPTTSTFKLALGASSVEAIARADFNFECEIEGPHAKGCES